MERRGAHILEIVGRMKAGVNLRTATADLQTIAAQLAKQYPDSDAGRDGTRLLRCNRIWSWTRSRALLVLLGAVALVLLIACANVANLFLARAATRSARLPSVPPWDQALRIVRQLLRELFLAMMGGVAGLLLAWWGVDLLRAASPADLPRLEEIRVNGLVLAFTLGIACLTSLIFGLIPALQASRPQVEQALKEAARGSTGGARSHRLRSAFVASQFALSLVLLVGAGLLIVALPSCARCSRGLRRTARRPFGKHCQKRATARSIRRTQFFDKLLVKLTTLPGIEKVGLVSPVPFSGSEQGRTFTIVGHPAPAEGMEPAASLLTTDGAYFGTMRIPLKRGRLFDPRDGKDAKPVVLINETFARKYFPNENPLGQQVQIGRREDGPPREIVGVVGTAKHGNLAEADEAEYYLAFAQAPDRYSDIVVRTERNRRWPAWRQ